MPTKPRCWVWVLTLVLFGALCWTTFAVAEDSSELTIGLIPEMNVFEQVDRFTLLAEYLSERIGRPIRLTMLSRYGNIVERIVSNELDGAFLGSFTGALAEAQLGMIPVAQPINLDGTSTYRGYIFVRRDSDIEAVGQMRDRRLALVERATTAGYIFPVAYLRGHGIEDLDAYFSDVQFWGSHDATIQAVLEGRADIGAAKNTIWEHSSRQDPRIETELEILATSAKVPSNGLFVSPQVDPSVREQIKKILLGMQNDSAAVPVLEKLRFEGFVPTDSESYQAVFNLTEKAGIDIASYTYRNE